MKSKRGLRMAKSRKAADPAKVLEESVRENYEVFKELNGGSKKPRRSCATK